MAAVIYLDYNATTPVDPRVLDAMLPYLGAHFGNASSNHVFGYSAHSAIVRARAAVAGLIGAREREIIFTGGASESNNLAIKGVAFAHLNHNPHIVSTTVEHPAVRTTLAYLKSRFGVNYTLVPVQSDGRVRPEDIAAALRPNTVLVTVMHANNEVGALQPVGEIGAMTRQRGVLFHVDAAQSLGKVPIQVETHNIDLLSIAGHKVYAPKGIGALYRRAGVDLDPLVHGSGQEDGTRAGTENVAGIVALGEACSIASADIDEDAERLGSLRDSLHASLCRHFPALQLNGPEVERLPNTLNVSFPGASGAAVLGCAPGIAASTGSACHSIDPEPSAVLIAMGLSISRALGAIRISLGRMTTRGEIERAGQMLCEAAAMAGATR